MTIDHGDCLACTDTVDMMVTVSVTLWFVLMFLEACIEDNIRLPRGVVSTNLLLEP